MHMSRRSRVEEYACSAKFNSFTSRKTPSTANAVPLPREGGLGDFARKHLIRHLSVTPSPTGEGNRKALFRQQIYTASVGERLDLMKGSLREGSSP